MPPLRLKDLPDDERRSYIRARTKDWENNRKLVDPEGHARSRQSARQRSTELKELRRIQRTGERPLNLLERFQLFGDRAKSLRSQLRHRERYSELAKARLATPEGKKSKARAAKKYNSTHVEENRSRRNAYNNSARSNSIQFRLSANLRTRTSMALRTYTSGSRKAGSAIRDLGCTVDELIVHLESLFLPDMTWDNYGSEWHADHVVALATFDLTNRDEFIAASHYTNLQPMWRELNISKSDWVEVNGKAIRGRELRNLKDTNL